MDHLKSNLSAVLAHMPEAVTINAIWAVTTLLLAALYYRPVAKLVDRSDRIEGELGPVKVRVGKSRAKIKRASLEKDGAPAKAVDAELKSSFRDAAQSRDISRRVVIWVDDKPENNCLEQEAFEALGITVVNVPSTDEALRVMRYSKVDLVISDMARPESESAGLELYEALKNGFYGGPFIIYAGTDNAMRAAKANIKATARPNELYEMVIEALR